MSVSLPNREIVLFVLGELGGRTARIDTETLAVECFKRYPSKFGLVKFPKYPDVDAVRVTLTDLKKQKYGLMVKGNKDDGWVLTENGLNWYGENRDRISVNIKQRHPLERRLPQGRNISREKIARKITDRLLESNAYKKWKSGNSISIYEFFDAMNVDQYLDESKYQEVLANTLQAVRGNSDLTDFVEQMNSQYGKRYRTYFIDMLKREAES
jgi:hypothetical protein